MRCHGYGRRIDSAPRRVAERHLIVNLYSISTVQGVGHPLEKVGSLFSVIQAMRINWGFHATSLMPNHRRAFPRRRYGCRSHPAIGLRTQLVDGQTGYTTVSVQPAVGRSRSPHSAPASAAARYAMAPGPATAGPDVAPGSAATAATGSDLAPGTATTGPDLASGTAATAVAAPGSDAGLGEGAHANRCEDGGPAVQAAGRPAQVRPAVRLAPSCGRGVLRAEPGAG